MKTMYKVAELFSNGDSNTLGNFDSIKEAKKLYFNFLADDGYQPDDNEKDFSIELTKHTSDDIETIESQNLYIEGDIDRLRNKEREPLMYYYKAFWNAKEKQLEYTFYFHGEEDGGGILENDLDKWYFR